jgi:hypothetical protein
VSDEVVLRIGQARTIWMVAFTYPDRELTIYPPIAGSIGIKIEGEEDTFIVDEEGRLTSGLTNTNEGNADE